MYVTGTSTVVTPVPLLAVTFSSIAVVTSPTFTVASFGNLSVKSFALTASSALAFANSFSLSGVVFLTTVTSPFATGNTVTGTVTFSELSFLDMLLVLLLLHL